jgi:hypothetical protein
VRWTPSWETRHEGEDAVHLAEWAMEHLRKRKKKQKRKRKKRKRKKRKRLL